MPAFEAFTLLFLSQRPLGLSSGLFKEPFKALSADFEAVSVGSNACSAASFFVAFHPSYYGATAALLLN